MGHYATIDIRVLLISAFLYIVISVAEVLYNIYKHAMKWKLYILYVTVHKAFVNGLI